MLRMTLDKAIHNLAKASVELEKAIDAHADEAARLTSQANKLELKVLSKREAAAVELGAAERANRISARIGALLD